MAKSKLKSTQLAIVDDNNNEYIVHEFEKQGLVVKTKEQLKSAISKLSSSEGTIIVVDNIIIDEDITVPENVMLKFFKGGKLTVNSGYTLTLDCAIDAGLFRIFDGNGAIDLSKAVKSVVTVDTIKELVLKTANIDGIGCDVNVLGYHEPGDGGGGYFYWDANEDKANHNGGTIIDPNIAFPTDWNYTPQQSIWFTAGTGSGCWKRIYDGVVNIKWFGAKTDGSDCQGVFNAVKDSGVKDIYLPAGTYTFTDGLLFNEWSGFNFTGVSSEETIIKWLSGKGIMKGLSFSTFTNIGFHANQLDGIQQEMIVSNFNTIKFKNCTWKLFGSNININKTGSCCLFLYAGDVNTSDFKSGISDNAVLDNCNFYGYGRKTNFGIRIYTEFTGSTSTLTNVKILNSNFDGFNWNAVEVAGLQTSFITIDNCVGNLNGLCPFEIDKGAHHCSITNIKINRLLGNIDKDNNPNTRIAVAMIQGYLPTEGYSNNNIIDGVLANLLKSDIDAFNSYTTSGLMCAAISYAYDCEIKNVKVTIDGIPDRHVSSVVGMCLVAYETISGCTFENIKCDNAREGIIQTSGMSDGMTYSKTNIIRDIENTNTLKGEIAQLSFGASSSAKVWVSIQDCILKTDLTDPYIVPASGRKYAVNCQAHGSSTHFVHFKDCYFGVPLADTDSWFCLNQIYNLAFDNIMVGGISQNDRFIHSEGSTVPSKLYLNNIMGAPYGNAPLYMDISLQNNNQTCSIYGKLNIYTAQPESYDVTLVATSTPSYPPIAYWHTSLKIEKETKTAGGYTGWVKIGTAWKGYGLIEA